MADQLRTDFLDDILSEEMNQKRRYRVIQNDDGTISLEDATTYTQEGDNYGAQQINEERSAINDRLPLSGGTLTGDLTIHKNEPSLLLKNEQGGDQGIKMHYYGSESGKNTFSIYDVANAKQLLKIAQANAYAEFAGGIKSGGNIQSLGTNNYGTVYAGDKIRMYTDAEGGNLRIFPPNDTGNFWEFDAYNGNMRLFHYDAANKKVNTQFNFGSGGTVSAPCVKNVFTVTEAGYVADARALKALNDKITALQTPSKGSGTKANANILADGFNCHYTKIGRVVQLSIEFATGATTISNQKQKLAAGVPVPAYPEQSLGIMHCAYANYSPVAINVTSDGVYTWYCGDLNANAMYRGFIVYIANS